MKEIIKTTYQVSFDNQTTWRDCLTKTEYKEKDKDEYVVCEKFSVLENLAQLHFGNLKTSRTLFNKTKVSFWLEDGFCDDIVYTERTFKRDAPLNFRKLERVIKPSTRWLIDNLSIEEINEYYKDRNIKWCLNIK